MTATEGGRSRRVYIWVAILLLSGIGFGWFYGSIFLRTKTNSPLIASLPVVVTQEPASPAFQMTPTESFKFEGEASLALWEQKVFKGHTDFAIKRDAQGSFLSTVSKDSSCGLFMKVRHEASSDLYLRWRWRAHSFPRKKEPGRLSNRTADDFAARVYVIFEASNLFRSDVIEYVWDESIAAGQVADSPYSERIKLFVIRSGKSEDPEQWSTEARNPLEDYRKLFGKAPKHPVGIVALMCDSDNTGTEAAADFADIEFGTETQTAKSAGG